MRISFRSPTMVVASVALTVAVAAQEQPKFEVASIKSNASADPWPGGGPSGITRRGETLVASNATLISLVRWAYRPLVGRSVPDHKVIGGPPWVRRQRFDIEAKAGGVLPYERLSVLLQALLEERFGLVVEHGVVEREVYVLRRVRRDGSLGPALVRSSDDE